MIFVSNKSAHSNHHLKKPHKKNSIPPTDHKLPIQPYMSQFKSLGLSQEQVQAHIDLIQTVITHSGIVAKRDLDILQDRFKQDIKKIEWKMQSMEENIKKDIQYIFQYMEDKFQNMEDKFQGKLERMEDKFQGKLGHMEDKFQGKLEHMEDKFHRDVKAMGENLVSQIWKMSFIVNGAFFAAIATLVMIAVFFIQASGKKETTSMQDSSVLIHFSSEENEKSSKSTDETKKKPSW